MNTEKKVAGFRQNKCRYFAWNAVALLALCCLSVLCLTSGADALMAFPAWARWLAFLVLLAVGVGIVAGLWIRPRWRFDGKAAVRDIERGNPELGQMVRTSLQVGVPDEAARAGFSPALVRALHAAAAGRLDKVDTERLVPWPRVRRLGLACGALALAVLCAVVLWADFRRAARRVLLPAAHLYFTSVTATPDVTQFERGDTVRIEATLAGRPVRKARLHLRTLGNGGWDVAAMAGTDATHFSSAIAGRNESFEFFVTAGDGRSRRRTVRFIDPPVVRRVELRVSYPAYTGIAPQTVENRDVVAVEGSTIEFRFELNHALRRGRLRLGEQSLAVELHGNDALAAWTVVAGDREFSMEGADADGLPLRKLAYTVRGLDDKVPRVEILEPPEDVETARNGVVPVRVRARDDFGLAELGVVLRVDGKEFALDVRRFEGDLIFSAEQSVMLDLAEYPVSPTTVNQIYAYARDRGPDATRRGVSELRNILIRVARPPAVSAPPGAANSDPELARGQVENLRQLDDVIREQRRAVSTTFRMQEEKAREPKATQAEAAREANLAQRVKSIRDELPDLASPGAKAALAQAAERMESAAAELQDRRLTSALRSAEEALASLLEAKRELAPHASAATQRQQQQASPRQSAPTAATSAESADGHKTLDALADEAARLAQEERRIGDEMDAAGARAHASSRVQGAPSREPETAAPSRPGTTPSTSHTPAAPEDSEAPDATLALDTPRAQAQSEAAAARAAAHALTPRQTQAAADGAELRGGVAAAAAATPLARRRMQEAATAMQAAADDLLAQRLPEAAGALNAAEHKLAQVAEHLRGLAKDNPVAALEQARVAAERAAAALQTQGQQRQGATMRAPTPAAEAAASTLGSQPAPSDQPPWLRSPPSAERAAQDAETIADWLDRVQARDETGTGALRNQLARARTETGLERLPADLRGLQASREEGKPEQAAQAQQDAAARLGRLAAALDRAKQRLVQSQVERLASAEATARQLKQQLDSGPRPVAAAKTPASDAATPASGRGGQSETTARLRDLAQELKDLNDAELERLGNRLSEQMGAQNLRGKAATGKVVPKEVGAKVLTPAVQRLQAMIDEIVQREMLLTRDERVPDKYTRLVDSYFKALSDDLRE